MSCLVGLCGCGRRVEGSQSVVRFLPWSGRTVTMVSRGLEQLQQMD
jgi:hypothetical protein